MVLGLRRVPLENSAGLAWPGGAALRENFRGFVLRIVDGYHQKQAGALIAASGMCMTMEGSQRVVYGREGVHAEE